MKLSETEKQELRDAEARLKNIPDEIEAALFTEGVPDKERVEELKAERRSLNQLFRAKGVEAPFA
jgi:hypothetical protein